jgi:hypothetical protein
MKYFVTVRIEETIEVEADSEQQAGIIAEQLFDPTAHSPEIEEIWSNEDDE